MKLDYAWKLLYSPDFVSEYELVIYIYIYMNQNVVVILLSITFKDCLN